MVFQRPSAFSLCTPLDTFRQDDRCPAGQSPQRHGYTEAGVLDRYSYQVRKEEVRGLSLGLASRRRLAYSLPRPQEWKLSSDTQANPLAESKGLRLHPDCNGKLQKWCMKTP